MKARLRDNGVPTNAIVYRNLEGDGTYKLRAGRVCSYPYHYMVTNNTVVLQIRDSFANNEAWETDDIVSKLLGLVRDNSIQIDKMPKRRQAGKSYTDILYNRWRRPTKHEWISKFSKYQREQCR